jgi:predicted helicase
MPRIEPELQRLQEIKTLPSLLKYLKEDLNWPIGSDDVEEVTFDYDPAELGFDSASTAKIDEVRQLRPLTAGQKWGIFWVKFGKKQLPVQMLRRALGNLVVKKRASTKKSDKAAWHMHDLLFISAYGDDDNRHITFAHFSESEDSEKSLPVLKVLGWDDDDTLLHLKDTYKTLVTSLNWENTPVDDPEAWRKHWSSAFKVGHREVINTTKELVVELAQLATGIKKSVLTSIKAETEKGPWKKLMLAFQKTLIKDLDEDQFADVIAQTVSYGLLTARLSSDGQISLKNLVDMVPSTNPFLKELLQHFLTSAGMKGLFDVDEAGINDVVELLNRANAQAIRNDFGKKTDGEDPVIHFYEHFLGEYNKKLKVERGVFYTPQPVVSYIVRSVHELLQKEFGLEDGLADTSTWAEVKSRHKELKIPVGIKDPKIEPFVQILDPATGTATFLIEVIDVIHCTMVAKWNKERFSKADQVKKWNTYVPTHLLPRLYAYELMMAPYAIAHMKVGLKLTETGFTAWEKLGPENRANIFLTNALEPWSKQLELPGFDALAHEAAAVNEVKKNKRFTVVVGNPPYSSSSQNTHPWVIELIEDYKVTVRGEETQIQALSDDYVKFVRLGQFFLENSCYGILGFITNNNFQSATTFRDMRGSLSSSFNWIRLIDLHGNSRLKEHTADGELDRNVFDILAGVCISIFAKTTKGAVIRARTDLLGSRDYKYGTLNSGTTLTAEATGFSPTAPQYSFMSVEEKLAAEYEQGIFLPEFFGTGNYQNDKTSWYGSGFKTQQDEFAICFTRASIKQNVNFLLEPSTSESSLRARFTMCGTDQWSFIQARRELKSVDWEALVCPCLYRPFDVRYTVLHRGVVSNPRTQVMRQFLKKNLGMCVGRQGQAIPGAWNIVFATRHPEDQNLFYRGGNTNFPLYWYADDDELGLNFEEKPNLSHTALVRISQDLRLQINAKTGLPAGLSAEDIFWYLYAILHSQSYRSRYSEFLKIDFPRIPLTQNIKLFRSLAGLGSKLTALHLLESSKPEKQAVTFEGGRCPEIEKVSWSTNTVWIDKSRTIGFKGVKETVWNFEIGGYQVCEKWLKDRKERKLTMEDIEHYQSIVFAISETICLMEEIDNVIYEHGGWPGAFQAAK